MIEDNFYLKSVLDKSESELVYYYWNDDRWKPNRIPNGFIYYQSNLYTIEGNQFDKLKNIKPASFNDYPDVIFKLKPIKYHYNKYMIIKQLKQRGFI